jgi:hypothetical protein
VVASNIATIVILSFMLLLGLSILSAAKPTIFCVVFVGLWMVFVDDWAGAGVRHARRRAALCADWPEAAARRPPGNIYLGVYFCTCIRYDVEQRTAELCWHRLCIPSF